MICLITPWIPQIEERLASWEGLWDSVDLPAYTLGYKTLTEIRTQSMHSVVLS